MKTVSIIIPTYNRAHHLERLLKQLDEQTVPPDEIIVVDDHSTDTTRRMVQVQVRDVGRIRYIENSGRYQRDAKATGLAHATGSYIGFLDDDVSIDDSSFFARLRTHIDSDRVVQAKVILEQMGQNDEPYSSWCDPLTVRPYPILELLTARLNGGIVPRRIYPMIEFGNFWPAHFKHLFIDRNLILDGYGESYASALQLYRRSIPLILIPDLVIRHPGASKGGSKRFDKQHMLRGFTRFHNGYFTNMIYLHARYFPWWILAWLPFYLGKACVAVVVSRDIRGCITNALRPLARAVWKFWIRREYV